MPYFNFDFSIGCTFQVSFVWWCFMSHKSPKTICHLIHKAEHWLARKKKILPLRICYFNLPWDSKKKKSITILDFMFHQTSHRTTTKLRYILLSGSNEYNETKQRQVTWIIYLDKLFLRSKRKYYCCCNSNIQTMIISNITIVRDNSANKVVRNIKRREDGEKLSRTGHVRGRFLKVKAHLRWLLSWTDS